MDQVRDTLRLLHYSLRTEETYLQWIRRFVLFHQKRHPREMGAPGIEQFLTHLAVQGSVAASTQNQALNALVFLYKRVLKLEPGEFGEFERAKVKRKLPVVLSREEVTRLISEMDWPASLIGLLLYGAGLRIIEALRLRVKDIDFSRKLIIVRDGKGEKDRVTMLPECALGWLREHLRQVRQVFDQDRRDGLGGVWLPHALERKYRNAGREWSWQWVFPAADVSRDPRGGALRRHHLHETMVQKAMRRAAFKAQIPKPVSPIASGIVLRPICSNREATFARSRSFWATMTFPRP